MDVIQVHDMLNVNEDCKILNLLKNEKLYYSNMITKINHYGLSQERSIILTNIALYNMKKQNLKRRMPYKEILGITFSNISNEFVVHGNISQYDYHYNSKDKNLIISLITFFYDGENNSLLKLCEVPEKSLKNFVTGKKEKQKDSSYTKMDTNYLIDTNEFQENNMECLFFGTSDENIFESNIHNFNDINIINNDSNSNNISKTNSSKNNDNNINFSENNESSEDNINYDKKMQTYNIINNIKNSSQKDNERIKETGTIFSKHKDIKNVGLNDFKILKVIGRGTFGKVCLVQYKLTKEYYAMKIMKKDVLLEHNQVKSALLEKKILQNLNYKFLVGMVFCFQTQERIYFVMNFIRGGELFKHLCESKYFPEEKTKFYAGIVGLALEYLHTHGIVYRDIKPDNILIDEDGYLKLADFGMAKFLKDKEKAFSFCGTPEYFAPEIITREGHNHAADWWSYGVLLYEMLFGIPPFYSNNYEKMFDLITESQLRFPRKIIVSEDAKDLIRKLLVKDQDLRLGSNEGFEAIKNHSFFKGFDFKALEEKKMNAPYIPKLDGSIDLTNFDSKYTSEEVATSAISQGGLDLIKTNQELFEDF